MSTSLGRPRTMNRQDEVLDRFASISPRQLYYEAKLEKCRALKDLRTCGRNVQHCLTSCGHACLCMECAQRTKICPVCRNAIRRLAPVLRLHDDLLDAGLLVQVRDDDMFCTTVDARRLYQFFDVALENNLVPVISHYVSDVCFNETVLSSDPSVSVLLDSAVVKEWCRKTFQGIMKLLKDSYKLGTVELTREPRLEMLDKAACKLNKIIEVLKSLDIPASQTYVDSVKDLKILLEAVKRALQHLQVMLWAARNKIFDSSSPRFADFNKWRAALRQRKQAAQERAWQDYVLGTGLLGGKPSTSLFIEEALMQLQVGSVDDLGDEGGDVFGLEVLRQSSTTSPAFGKPGEKSLFGTASPAYPPDSVRTAIDNFFLDGRSENFLAKKTIFLYYLFDRLWSPTGQWKLITDDYIKTFSIPWHFALETFVFFLLDDDSSDALQRACEQLDDLSKFSSHPRLPRVLLERQQPDAALSLLSRNGRLNRLYRGVETLLLSEVVTVVRILLESDSLVNAFLYQRSHTSKARENSGEKGPGKFNDTPETERHWTKHMEILVGEICWFCIRKSRADKIMSLPWDSEEQEIVHRCFMARATQKPGGTAGHLLVVFYIKRCQFVEAQRVHQKLCELEDHEENKNLIYKAREYRSRLIDYSLNLSWDKEKEIFDSEDISVDEGDDAEADMLDASDYENVMFLQPSVSSVSGSFLKSSPLFSKPSKNSVSFSAFTDSVSNRLPQQALMSFVQPALNGQGGLFNQGSKTVLGITADSNQANGNSPLLSGSSYLNPLFGNGHGLAPSPDISRRLQYGGADLSSDQGGVFFERHDNPVFFADKGAGIDLLSAEDVTQTDSRVPFNLQPSLSSPVSYADLGSVTGTLGNGFHGFQNPPVLSSGPTSNGGYGQSIKRGRFQSGLSPPETESELQSFQSPTISSSPGVSRRWGLAEDGAWGWTNAASSLTRIGEGNDRQFGSKGIPVSPKVGNLTGEGSWSRGADDGFTQYQNQMKFGGFRSPISR